MNRVTVADKDVKVSRPIDLERTHKLTPGRTSVEFKTRADTVRQRRIGEDALERRVLAT